MADLTERTAAAAVANNDSEDTSESDGDAATDDFTVLDEVERSSRQTVHRYDADTPLYVQLLDGDTVARGGANWWRWGRAARPPWLIVVSTPGWLMDHITSAEGFSLPHLRYLVIDEADRVMEMAETGWLKAVEGVAAATARRPASPAG
ncbi:DEAD-box ATP-dependent RNA helicase 1 [Amphibalanus amphitrite]|uniref:DEAD-box ATP-dependent RNA helicase 1 n=1 Tax=Amphibalanus amphitrite TaxID=1232801 RepID=A0A6A4WUR4_AMPAM|nr:DEAD-box ATP-dependent RNA helicase 1 [Amphibalanus amphitrite]